MKRYDMYANAYDGIDIEEDATGEWVKFEDVESLLTEVRDAHRTIACAVRSNGGELRISDQAMIYHRDTDIINRREDMETGDIVFTVSGRRDE